MGRKLLLIILSFFLASNISFASIQVSQQELNLSLNASSQVASSFSISANTTENVSLNTGSNYLKYSWKNQSITNQTYANFTFIVPLSGNLTANLSWANPTNELNFSLTNLRTGDSYSNNSNNTPLILDLNSTQVSYGVWRASVFGSNISGSDETFNLTINPLDNRFETNFTEITHSFENKTVSNHSSANWSFYVDGASVNSVTVYLETNGTNTTTLYLYNSTNLSSANLVNSTNTSNGIAFLNTTNILNGYWTVLINNTNENQSRDYNLTISLQGDNIRKLGNLTNQSITSISFNVTSPETELVDGNYTYQIQISTNSNTQSMALNLDLSAPILKVTPNWKAYNYFGNQTLLAGLTESYNLTQNFYVNINQTKTLIFLINNTGSLNLTNLSQINSTNLTGSDLSLNIIKISLSNTTVPAGGIGYLNLTIEPPENLSYVGNTFVGWVYLNSSNGQPFNHLNLTFNLTVTNQTLNQLNSTLYYFSNPEIGFNVFYFDNRTLSQNWNTSLTYHLNITNSSNTSHVIGNISFTASGGAFSGTLNTTNMTEGNYTLLGTIYDLANNFAEINSTFELLHNLNLKVTVPDNTIVKDEDFIFSVNVSKLGNVIAKNVSVCLEIPSDIINSSALCNTSAGSISNTSAKILNWTLRGTSRGNYTINVTAYSSDSRFNKTIQHQVAIKYGYLVISVDEDTPSSKYANTSFTIYIDITNNGNLKASNVTAKIRVCGETKTTDCTNEDIGAGETKNKCDASFSCSSTGDKDIDVKLDGVQNATCSWGSCSSFTTVGTISIVSSSDDDDNNDGGGSAPTNYDILFKQPSFSEMSIKQGGSSTLDVVVKNTGNSELKNCYLKLSGIDSSVYTIEPSGKNNLAAGSYLSYAVVFEIPEDFEAKTYTVWLNFTSDEYSEKKYIKIKILELSLDINLTDLKVIQGESKTYTFTIKNTGNSTLDDLNLNISGLSKEYFSFSPEAIDSLDENESTSIDLVLSIPKNEEIGEKNLELVVTTSEKTFTKSFILTVTPSEEEIENINSQYLDLLAKYENLTKALETAKKEGKNTSSLEEKMDSLNNSLTKIKSYIEQGDYIKAKNEIESAISVYSSLNTPILQDSDAEKGEESLVLVVVIALSIVLLGVVLAYTYVIPKKRYEIKKAYKFKRKGGFVGDFKSSLGSLVDTLNKKLHRRIDQEEILRKRKLKEWKKYYDELKKNKHGK